MKRLYGKKAARADARRLQFSSYTAAALPAPPDECDRTYGITDWTDMANSGTDQPPPAVRICGDCAWAAAGHAIMAWSMGTTKKPLILSAQTIVDAYASTGYNPGTGANDNGSNLIDTQEYWRTTGIGGNKIAAYAGVSIQGPLQVKEAIFYYGGCYIGVNLPGSAEQQTDANLAWTSPWFSPIVGGHCVQLLSYTAKYLWCITWGKIQAMTWDFFFRYCDEAYAIVDPLWIGASGISPSNLNLDALIADLGVVNQKSLAPPVILAA
jgi:hypothetical protein